MVNNYYDLITFGLGNQNFQDFVDTFKLKYNTPQTDGFAWDNEIQLDYTYEQLIASLNITTLPVYVDVDSEGLDKSLGEFVIGSNKIPTQKHRYAMNAKMLRERMILAQKFGESALNGEARTALMNLLFESTDKLLEGNRNALTHQRMRVCSTGQFTIGLDNNPRGLTGITFDFGVPSANKESLTTTARWWTNASHITANEGSASDPLLYLKNKAKAARKAGYPSFHFEMAEDLFDDLLTHSKVLQRIGYSLYPSAATDANAQTYAGNLTDDAKKDAIQRIIGCPIKTYDSLAAVEKFDSVSKSIKPEMVENFTPTNVSLVPDGQIGTIKSVRPMVFTDDPTQRIAWFDGGRTLITNRFEAKTKTMYVESEMAVLCVPNMPQYMQIYTVTV